MVEHALALSSRSFVLTRGLDRAQDYTWTEVSKESAKRCTGTPSSISDYGLDDFISLGPSFVGVFISSNQLILIVNKFTSLTRTDFIGRPITLTFAVFYPLSSLEYVRCRFYAMEDVHLANLDRRVFYTNDINDYEVNIAEWWRSIDGTVTWASNEGSHTVDAFDGVGLLLFRLTSESSARNFDPPLNIDGIRNLLKIPTRVQKGKKERSIFKRRFI